jgi:hypothetical protein
VSVLPFYKEYSVICDLRSVVRSVFDEDELNRNRQPMMEKEVNIL